jgi:hypothetical protein
LQSHNQLSARYLRKKAEASIYNNAEIGKAEMSLKNWTMDFRISRMPGKIMENRGNREMTRHCRICWWMERAGGGIIPAWRDNQRMKSGVRRERTLCQPDAAMTPNHQNVEM